MFLKDKSIPYSKVNSVDIDGAIVVGEFVDIEKPEFVSSYYELAKKAKK